MSQRWRHFFKLKPTRRMLSESSNAHERWVGHPFLVCDDGRNVILSGTVSTSEAGSFEHLFLIARARQWHRDSQSSTSRADRSVSFSSVGTVDSSTTESATAED